MLTVLPRAICKIKKLKTGILIACTQTANPRDYLISPLTSRKNFQRAICSPRKPTAHGHLTAQQLSFNWWICLAAGLLKLGIGGNDMTVENQDKVVLISRNRPEWLILGSCLPANRCDPLPRVSNNKYCGA